jgi:hypothetical protein
MVRALASNASLSQSSANRAKLDLLAHVLRKQLDAALARGFHGITAIELAIQDGTIQHVKHRVERTEK